MNAESKLVDEIVAAIANLTDDERSRALQLILCQAAREAKAPLVVRDCATGLATALLCPLDRVGFADKNLELMRRCLLFDNAKQTGEFEQLDPVDGETLSGWMASSFPDRYAE
jgi:hypothetical protein